MSEAGEAGMDAGEQARRTADREERMAVARSMEEQLRNGPSIVNRPEAGGNAVGRVAGAMGDVISNAENENPGESATGGMGAALIEAVGTTAKLMQTAINKVIRNRAGTMLTDLDRNERIETVVVLREQRAEHLRSSKRGGAMGDRARRAGMQRDRAKAAGREQPRKTREQRMRQTAERARTVDGGVLYGRRAPGPMRAGAERVGSILSLSDARGSIARNGPAGPASDRTVDARASNVRTAPLGKGPAVTGKMRPVNISRTPPVKLNLSPQQTVNRAPTDGAARTPGLAAQRGMMSQMGQGMRMGR